ncbi:hypothetical protein [Bradyrhizobium sp.]|uniref:hypothetical protein n=1 Tax=Bradyrhizobium sp. TaxID=376 RepID=UPI003C33D312
MRILTWVAVAMLPAAYWCEAIAQSAPSTALAASEVYIQQSHGRVAPGTKVQKPPPEAGGALVQAAGPTAPDTCNAQNAASSQACHTATQQARPATR